MGRRGAAARCDVARRGTSRGGILGKRGDKAGAEAANRAKTDFLAVMSHEIRTPMNAVLGAADLLKRTRLDAGQAEHVEMLAAASQSLMQILNDVLDLSKIEAGKLSLNFEAVDIAFVIAEAVRLMRNRADAAGLELVAEVGALPEVQADDRAVKQILLNLLSNAIKFTPRGGVVKVKAEALDVQRQQPPSGPVTLHAAAPDARA
jgi:two-component system cell cycle sensor histidine kinase PleC